MQTQTVAPLQKRVDLIPANILINKPSHRNRKLRVKRMSFKPSRQVYSWPWERRMAMILTKPPSRAASRSCKAL